jgi:ADP-ribose pyrophosphatase
VTEAQGAWQTFGERTIYDNRWVRLGLVDVQAPNGERWEYHVVHFDRIAIGLIVDDQDRVLMLWRYRFATDQWGYELLGGLVEEGEEPAATAAREVAEESGWRPIGEPEHLISFEPLPGQVTAPVDVFLWRKAEKVGEPTDTEEVGRLEWVPLSRIPELAQQQQILGSGALVPLLYYIASRGTGGAGGQDESPQSA